MRYMQSGEAIGVAFTFRQGKSWGDDVICVIPLIDRGLQYVEENEPDVLLFPF